MDLISPIKVRLDALKAHALTLPVGSNERKFLRATIRDVEVTDAKTRVLVEYVQSTLNELEAYYLPPQL